MSEELKMQFMPAFELVIRLSEADDLPHLEMDRWLDDASESDKWVLHMLDGLDLYPKPRDYTILGARAVAFGVLIGSTFEEPADNKDDPTWVGENLVKLMELSPYPEQDAFETNENVDFVTRKMLWYFVEFDRAFSMDTLNDLVQWLGQMAAIGILTGRIMLLGS